MIDYAGLGYIQIDAGRIGGITAAKAVADYASAKGVQFVNHTFTTALALSASIQPYAGLQTHELCECPVEPSALAREVTAETLPLNSEGRISLPEKPGLGFELNPDVVKAHLAKGETYWT